eukprot:934843-Amphidinium_carterae.2
MHTTTPSLSVELCADALSWNPSRPPSFQGSAGGGLVAAYTQQAHDLECSKVAVSQGSMKSATSVGRPARGTRNSTQAVDCCSRAEVSQSTYVALAGFSEASLRACAMTRKSVRHRFNCAHEG